MDVESDHVRNIRERLWWFITLKVSKYDFNVFRIKNNLLTYNIKYAIQYIHTFRKRWLKRPNFSDGCPNSPQKYRASEGQPAIYNTRRHLASCRNQRRILPQEPRTRGCGRRVSGCSGTSPEWVGGRMTSPPWHIPLLMSSGEGKDSRPRSQWVANSLSCSSPLTVAPCVGGSGSSTLLLLPFC